MSFTIIDGVFYKSRSGVGSEKLVKVPDGVTEIGQHAFEGESCQNIFVPPSVKRIGKEAFAWCENLRGITLSEGLTELCDGAFCGCKKLTSVHLPSTLEKIGKEVFEGCIALESITVADGNPAYRADGNCLTDVKSRRLIGGCKLSVIPNDGSVTEIAKSAFNRINGPKKLTLPDSLVKMGSAAFSWSGVTQAHMPPKVKSIGAEAYRGCGLQRLTLGNVERIGYAAFDCCYFADLDIPDSVLSIGKCAFSYGKLERLKIGRGVKTIPEGAFKHNYGLGKIEFSEGLTSIDNDAFAYCYALERVEIPKSVTYIGKHAFKGCKLLREVHFANEETVVAEDAFYGCIYKHAAPVQKGSDSDFECKGTTLMKYKGTEKRVVIPDFITKLSGKPFAKNTAVEEIIIPKGVTAVAVHSFEGCDNLRMLSVETGNKRLRSEGSCIIDNKTNTLTVGCNGSVLPDSGVAAIGASAFKGCKQLECAVIPHGVKTIGANAFHKCVQLKEVAFPDGLETVESGAFAGCKSLVGAKFGKGLKTIEEKAFSGCIALKTLEVTEIESVGFRAFYGCGKLEGVNMPEGLKKIGNSAFENCNGLVSISLPSTVTDIGYHVFPSGPILESIKVAEGNPVYLGRGNCIVHLGVKYQEPYYRVIYGCKNTVIPSGMGIRVIDGAFTGCVGLTELDIPDGVESVFSYAFEGCTGLKRLSIPDSFGYFDVFSDSRSLESVTAPKRMWDYFKSLNAEMKLAER